MIVNRSFKQSYDNIPKCFAQSFHRLCKDLSLLARQPEISKRLQFLLNTKINYAKESDSIEVTFKYFPYNKNGKSLHQCYHLEVVLRANQYYPFSSPNVEVAASTPNKVSFALQYYQKINTTIKEYIDKQWKPVSNLLFVFQYVRIKVAQHFMKLVQVPFEICLNNVQELTSSVASTVKEPGFIIKRTKKRFAVPGLNSQTKNLNRHFRSKLREILRQNQNNDPTGVIKKVMNHFAPNRVGFKEIREGLSHPEFNEILKREMVSGQFFRRIMTSSMKVESKLLMMKYYPVMEEAINDPQRFTRWKY